MNKPLAATLAALAAMACASDSPAKEKGAVMHSALDLVPQLVQSRPFRKDEVARITGVDLQEDAAQTNRFYRIFKGRAAGPQRAVQGAELRAALIPGKDGLLILEVGPAPCVTQKEVLNRFGADAQPVPPSPHGPKDAPTYLVYKKEWGDLRFGFAHKGQCLQAIVLDAIGK